MMTVYRVENDAGEGPYWASARPVWRAERVYDKRGYKHPSPLDDFPWLEDLHATLGERILARFHFAFPSVRAAVRWFGAAGLRELAACGFTLRAYEVPCALVSSSGRQCMFVRERARPARHLPKPATPRWARGYEAVTPYYKEPKRAFTEGSP